jgi:hypothetical protein
MWSIHDVQNRALIGQFREHSPQGCFIVGNLQIELADARRDEINVVAHRTEAAIVRPYVQSDAFGVSVLAPDGCAVQLPTIGKLILAVPACW